MKTRAGSVRHGLSEGARLLTLTLETEEERIEAMADLFAKAATRRR